MRIQDAINKGTLVTERARIDKLALELLLAFILQKDREYIFAHKEELITSKQYKKFIDLITRHVSGEPLAYITKNKEFFGIPLYVDNRVLIPRPETEHLVEKVMELVNSDKNLINLDIDILDVGTGSGNIAIALLKKLKNVHITATDINKNSLIVALRNVKKYSLENRITLIQSDLLKKIADKKFDIIIANLPYIGTKEYNFISKEAKEFEPLQALYGGDDGLKLYERLFKEIIKFNSCRYYLLGEIGFLHRLKLEKLLSKYFHFAKYEILQDLAGLDRYFVVHFKYDR